MVFLAYPRESLHRVWHEKSKRIYWWYVPLLEEAGRWAAQLEAMGWQTVNFYPTSEASPYDPFDPESETIWGQMQVLSDRSKSQKKVINSCSEYRYCYHRKSFTTPFTTAGGFSVLLFDFDNRNELRV